MKTYWLMNATQIHLNKLFNKLLNKPRLTLGFTALLGVGYGLPVVAQTTDKPAMPSHNAMAAHPMPAHTMPAPTQSFAYFSLAMRAIQAQQDWPIANLPGVLQAGSGRSAENGVQINHTEAGLVVFMPKNTQAKLSIAQHGDTSSAPILDAAWLKSDALLNESSAYQLGYQLGRQQFPMGQANLMAKHHAAFSAVPFAMRAVLNENWQADGLNLHYQATQEIKLSLGVWQNDQFPGAPETKLMPNAFSFNAQWQTANLFIGTSLAKVHSAGRSLDTIGTARHSHHLASCDTLDENRVCFMGAVEVMNITAKWQPANQSWWLASEWFYKQDKGQLDSIYGVPNYQGQLAGGWLDVGYQLNANWQVVGRAQHLIAQHKLVGVNTQIIADQAKILNSESPLYAQSVSFNWQPKVQQTFGLELHNEQLANQNNKMLMVRYHQQFNYYF